MAERCLPAREKEFQQTGSTHYLSLSMRAMFTSKPFVTSIRAHSVNQLEDNQVFVLLTPQFAEQQEPTHITVDRGHLLTIGLPDLRRLVSLVEALRKVVASEIESETSRVLGIARAMPIDEIKVRSTESIAIPGKAETFRVRKKFEQ